MIEAYVRKFSGHQLVFELADTIGNIPENCDQMDISEVMCRIATIDDPIKTHSYIVRDALSLEQLAVLNTAYHEDFQCIVQLYALKYLRNETKAFLNSVWDALMYPEEEEK